MVLSFFRPISWVRGASKKVISHLNQISHFNRINFTLTTGQRDPLLSALHAISSRSPLSLLAPVCLSVVSGFSVAPGFQPHSPATGFSSSSPSMEFQYATYCEAREPVPLLQGTEIAACTVTSLSFLQ